MSAAVPAGSLLAQRFLELHPGAAARSMEASPPAEVGRVLSRCAPAAAVEVLRRVHADLAARVLEDSEEEAAGRLLTALDPARAANLLGRLDPQARTRLLSTVRAGLAREIEEILTFPPGTAGRLMDARVATFSADSPVRSALEKIRDLGDRRISDLVLIDADGSFAGTVRLQEIVGAGADRPLAELRSSSPVHVLPMTSRDEVVEHLDRHRLASLPVVDLDGQVVGVIRHGGLVDAAKQDAAADLQQMVGGSGEERALSSPWTGVKSRLPWLNINLLTAFLASAVVGLFEDTIAQFTAVAVLLPVVAGQSGNTGAQALAVTMRGLSLREIRISHGFRVLLKELVVGLVNGVAIAVVTAAGVYLWSDSYGLALVMFLAMIMSMVAASASGALIPIVLQRLGRDPATASSIILTTVTDIVGFFSFLGLATVMASMIAGS